MPEGTTAYGSIGGPPRVPWYQEQKSSKEGSSEEASFAIQDPEESLKEFGQDFPDLVLPLLFFTITLLPCAMPQHLLMGILGIIFSATAASGLVLFARNRTWFVLSVTCFISAVFGSLLGYYDRERYIDLYHVYERSTLHDNVLPTISPESILDAGTVLFSADTYIDVSKSVGFQEGHLWCVAPIMRGTGLTTIGFWAVGQDCCRKRGFFRCGETGALLGGVRVLDVGIDDAEIPTYTQAAEEAAAVYNLAIPQARAGNHSQPMFIEWGVDKSTEMNKLYGNALMFCLVSVVAYFLIIPVYAACLWFLGLSLHDRPPSPAWHPQVVALMRFGIQVEVVRYPRDLLIGLLDGRTYWSGEVLHDYVFYLANRNTFLGCFFCHPAHPYTKWERFAVLLLVACLVVFPVAALHAAYGEASWAAAFLALFLVTVPRNMLRVYLIQFSQKDEDILRMDRFGNLPDRKESEAKKKGRRNQVFFLIGAVAITGVVCYVCINTIQNNVQDDLMPALLAGLDGLGYAFILELLLDLILPHTKHTTQGWVVGFGFFGRWRLERDEYAPLSAVDEDQLAPARGGSVRSGSRGGSIRGGGAGGALARLQDRTGQTAP